MKLRAACGEKLNNYKKKHPATIQWLRKCKHVGKYLWHGWI